MKKLFYLLAVAALATTALFSCKKGTENPELDPPTNLAASDVTTFSATLTWAGTAANYQYRLDDGSPVDVAGKMVVLQDLAPATTYNWAVRTAEGGNFSPWVNGKAFTTSAEAAPVDFIGSWARYHGQLFDAPSDIGVFALELWAGENYNTEYNYPYDGCLLIMDVIGDLPALETPAEITNPKILPGTYTVTPRNIDYSNVLKHTTQGRMDYYTAGVHQFARIPQSGTMKIEADGDNYIVTYNIIMDDGYNLRGKYQGPIVADNWTLDTMLKEDVDMGTFSGGGYAKFWGNGGKNAYHWEVNLWNNPAIVYDDMWGTMIHPDYEPGVAVKILVLDLFSDKSKGTAAIPVGTYPINASREPGTVNVGGWGQEGTTYIDAVTGDIGQPVAQTYGTPKSGSVVISKSGDTYTVELVDVIDDSRYKIKGKYVGPIEILDFSSDRR